MHCYSKLEAPHLARRDIEGSSSQIHSLKGINEGQKQNHARPLGVADAAQTEHDHPLIGGDNLSKCQKEKVWVWLARLTHDVCPGPSFPSVPFALVTISILSCF